jgi:hypothetical protein
MRSGGATVPIQLLLPTSGAARVDGRALLVDTRHELARHRNLEGLRFDGASTITPPAKIKTVLKRNVGESTRLSFHVHRRPRTAREK